MLKNKIIKRVTHPRKYNYFIWRGIVELLYQKKDNKAMTRRCVRWMGMWASIDRNFLCVENVTDIFYIDRVLYVTTRRPGLLIGKSGKDIDSLKAYINNPRNVIDNIYIIETSDDEPTTEMRELFVTSSDYV